MALSINRHYLGVLDKIDICQCYRKLDSTSRLEYDRKLGTGHQLRGGGGGGLQNGKIAGPKLFAPPPSRQGKTFRAPPFKQWKLFVPPLQYG